MNKVKDFKIIMQKYSKVNIITELPQITLKVLQVYNIMVHYLCNFFFICKAHYTVDLAQMLFRCLVSTVIFQVPIFPDQYLVLSTQAR